MVAQRGAGVEAKAAAKSEKAEAPKEKPARPPAKRKMNFSDRHDLEKLPGRLAELAKKIAELETKLAAPGLYARDPKTFAALSQALAEAQAAHAAGEERWLELEILREEIEG
jgi:ATP-binding cassette subfamily F protein uup